MKFEERKREEAVLSNLEAERRDEIERLTKNVRRLENELGEHKEKERSLIVGDTSSKQTFTQPSYFSFHLLDKGGRMIYQKSLRLQQKRFLVHEKFRSSF